MIDSDELPVVNDIVSLSNSETPHYMFDDMRILRTLCGYKFKSDTTLGHSDSHPNIQNLMDDHSDWKYIYITHDGVKRCYQRPGYKPVQKMRVIKD